MLLRKGVYLYEYMDDWKKVNEKSLPEKQVFYRHLDIEGITDAAKAHTKKLQRFEHKKFRRISQLECS